MNNEQRIVNETWFRGFPTKPGHYWFYGYPFGKITCGSENKKELILVEAFNTASGILVSAKSFFMYESEVEDARFKLADLPLLPTD